MRVCSTSDLRANKYTQSPYIHEHSPHRTTFFRQPSLLLFIEHRDDLDLEGIIERDLVL